MSTVDVEKAPDDLGASLLLLPRLDSNQQPFG
jgi:hypothetical protein